MHALTKFLLYLMTLWTLLTLGLILVTQPRIEPVIADKIAALPIPFNWVVSPRQTPQLVQVHNLNLPTRSFKVSEKQALLDQMPALNRAFKQQQADIMFHDPQQQWFTASLQHSHSGQALLQQAFAPRFQSLNRVVLFALGGDHRGRFIILDLVMQNDSPQYSNYLYKFYVNRHLKFTHLQWVGIRKNKAALPPLFKDAPFIPETQATVKVDKFFSELDLSNVYDDVTHLEKSHKYQNIAQGYDPTTQKAIKKIIQAAHGNFNNYAIRGYQQTDYPAQTELTVALGSFNQVLYYQFTVDNNNKRILHIKPLTTKVNP